jgi:hypothetical protein
MRLNSKYFYSLHFYIYPGLVNVSRLKYEIIDILVAVNVVILLYTLRKPRANGHEEELKILLTMFRFLLVVLLLYWEHLQV